MDSSPLLNELLEAVPLTPEHHRLQGAPCHSFKKVARIEVDRLFGEGAARPVEFAACGALDFRVNAAAPVSTHATSSTSTGSSC